jgi:hypothetical protein
MRNEEKIRFIDGNNGDSSDLRGKLDDFLLHGFLVVINRNTEFEICTLVGVRPAQPGRPGPPRPVTRTDADWVFLQETVTFTPT